MLQKKFLYNNVVKWSGEKKGLLSCDGKPDMKVSTPPEFRGHSGIWTPEDMFVASVNACVMTTFIHHAQRKDLPLKSYESNAEGTLEFIDGKLKFTEVIVMPRISVASSDAVEAAKNFISRAEKGCLISNSINCNVIVKSEILSS